MLSNTAPPNHQLIAKLVVLPTCRRTWRSKFILFSKGKIGTGPICKLLLNVPPHFPSPLLVSLHLVRFQEISTSPSERPRFVYWFKVGNLWRPWEPFPTRPTGPEIWNLGILKLNWMKCRTYLLKRSGFDRCIRSGTQLKK